MVIKKIVIEVGSGIDMYGEDVTKTAQRAVKNAISGASLPGLVTCYGLTKDQFNEKMIIEVTIATPYPDRVNGEEVLSIIPFGQKSIKVQEGGILTPGTSIKLANELYGTPNIVVAIAVITVYIETD